MLEPATPKADVVQLSEAEMLRKYGMSKPTMHGDCAIGWHEGTKPTDWKGNPVKGCISWETCICPCHVPINEMYEMAGVPRDVHPNPEWKPAERTWYMPVFGVDFGLGQDASIINPSQSAHTQQRNGSGPTGTRTFEPTPSGRAARGQLEDQVFEVVTEWLIDPGNELCTVRFIAWDIARFHNTSEPSTGAVAAVLDRWVRYGYCELEFRPTRLVGLTEEGKEKGLDVLRARYKRDGKGKR